MSHGEVLALKLHATGLRVVTENFSDDSQPTNRDSNLKLPEYEAGVVTLNSANGLSSPFCSKS